MARGWSGCTSVVEVGQLEHPSHARHQMSHVGRFSWDRSGIGFALSDLSFLIGVLEVCGYARSSPV